jgi:hypothetical protein
VVLRRVRAVVSREWRAALHGSATPPIRYCNTSMPGRRYEAENSVALAGVK